MRKTLTFLALLAVLFVSISAHSSRVIAPEQGYTSPELQLGNSASGLNLGSYRGQYVLLTFWSSTDAESRLRCNEYHSLLGQEENDIAFVSINLDSNDRLYEELVKYDGLYRGVNYHANAQERAELLEQFGMSSGKLKSFLIDRSGRIEAVNPDKTHLTL